VWDDISTTPKPCGLSTPNALGGLGQSGVKRPSGLHHQVWNAEEEQVEEEEEEEEEEEDEWNFPGSLNTQRDHAAAAKYGFGASSMAPCLQPKRRSTWLLHHQRVHGVFQLQLRLPPPPPPQQQQQLNQSLHLTQNQPPPALSLPENTK